MYRQEDDPTRYGGPSAFRGWRHCFHANANDDDDDDDADDARARKARSGPTAVQSDGVDVRRPPRVDDDDENDNYDDDDDGKGKGKGKGKACDIYGYATGDAPT